MQRGLVLQIDAVSNTMSRNASISLGVGFDHGRYSIRISPLGKLAATTAASVTFPSFKGLAYDSTLDFEAQGTIRYKKAVEISSRLACLRSSGPRRNPLRWPLGPTRLRRRVVVLGKASIHPIPHPRFGPLCTLTILAASASTEMPSLQIGRGIGVVPSAPST